MGKDTRTTAFVNNNHQTTQQNHQWTPTYLDKEGSRWSAILSGGWLGAAVYGELCHLGALSDEGWTGSFVGISRAIKERADVRSGKPRPSVEAVQRACFMMAEKGIMKLEEASSKQTVFRIVHPPDANDTEYRISKDKSQNRYHVTAYDNTLTVSEEVDVSIEPEWTDGLIIFRSADGGIIYRRREDVKKLVVRPIDNNNSSVDQSE